MNVLVLGGAGYVGSRVVPRLAQNHDVTVIDEFWFGDYLPDSIPKIRKNVMDLVEADMQGFDVVIFMAGLSNDPMSEFDPPGSFVQNASAPVYSAYIAKRAGVRKYVYASSCSVYGFSPATPMREDAPIRCNYPYGISKYTGEAGLFALADDFFKVVALRKGTISGASPRMRFDLLLNTMYKNIRTTNTITISNPDLHRPILSMEDAETVYLSAVSSLPSGVYNAVSFNTSLGLLAREVSSWAVDTLGVRPEYKVNFVGDLRNYVADGSKFWEFTGGIPSGSIYSILDDIHVQNYSDFVSAKFYNDKAYREIV